MWLKSFCLKNFKSFEDSGQRALHKRINVVVGQNSTGKTALLQALSFQNTPVPHKSSKLRPEDMPNPRSSCDFEFVLSGQELKDTLLSFDSNVYVPIPEDWVRLPDQANSIQAKLFEQPEIVFSAQWYAEIGGATGFSQRRSPSLIYSEPMSQRRFFCQLHRADNHASFRVPNFGAGENDNIAESVLPRLLPKVYFFNALRNPLPRHAFGNRRLLEPNAANLAEALGTLQPAPTAFRNYIDQVRRVLPLIKWVSVDPAGGNETEVRVWQVEESSGRNDLAIPLSQCGTGVGQVLAILYVVTQSRGNVIVIDEPNSFLHPGAAKALMNILREDTQNQYIISTHSPEVIAAIDPARLIALGFEQEHSIVREVDRADLDSTRDVLYSLGSRLSDVFGADFIVWVEGPTEVRCFPLLLKAAEINTAANLSIAALRATGDLEGSHAEALADIYRNLSASHALLPTTIALSLDGDKRSQWENSKVLKNAFGDVLHFIPRRCYENYLLDTNAICVLLNGLPYFREKPTSEGAVRDWIDRHGQEPSFGAKDVSVFSEDWLVKVDAPRLLDALFQSLSENTEIYRKTLHSLELTRWLIAHNRDSLAELISYVAELVPVAHRVP